MDKLKFLQVFENKGSRYAFFCMECATVISSKIWEFAHNKRYSCNRFDISILFYSFKGRMVIKSHCNDNPLLEINESESFNESDMLMVLEYIFSTRANVYKSKEQDIDQVIKEFDHLIYPPNEIRRYCYKKDIGYEYIERHGNCKKEHSQFELQTKDRDCLEKELKNFSNQHLYFFYSPTTETYKIGKSKNPESRLKAMFTAGIKAEIVCVLKNCGDLELELHERFKESRGIGEWFNETSELKLLIGAAKTKSKTVGGTFEFREMVTAKRANFVKNGC